MSTSHFGHTARFATFRPKNRPILAASSDRGGGRPAAVLPEGRTGGVGGSTTRPPVGPEPGAIEEAVALALDTLTLLQNRAHEVADGFRWGRVADANQGLGEIVQSTHTLLRLAVAAARATGANLQALCAAEGVRVDEGTQGAVDRLISRQFARDWQAVADSLDFEFIPALARWRGVFESLGAPPDPGGFAA